MRQRVPCPKVQTEKKKKKGEGKRGRKTPTLSPVHWKLQHVFRYLQRYEMWEGKRHLLGMKSSSLTLMPTWGKDIADPLWLCGENWNCCHSWSSSSNKEGKKKEKKRKKGRTRWENLIHLWHCIYSRTGMSAINYPRILSTLEDEAWDGGGEKEGTNDMIADSLQNL